MRERKKKKTLNSSIHKNVYMIYNEYMKRRKGGKWTAEKGRDGNWKTGRKRDKKKT